ncbi:ORF14 [Barthadenovirus mellis]|uniref:ORF14 n=1 Tax=Passerine adenovirus 1 TaxID=2779174 RepID=A0A7L9DIU6_9ADEN|nr:ORF14 [Passerine adenovirus 1]
MPLRSHSIARFGLTARVEHAVHLLKAVIRPRTRFLNY